jgi:hypothetical protein
MEVEIALKFSTEERMFIWLRCPSWTHARLMPTPHTLAQPPAFVPRRFGSRHGFAGKS